MLRDGLTSSGPLGDLTALRPHPWPTEPRGFGRRDLGAKGQARCRQARGQGESEDSNSKKNLQAHWWDLVRVVCVPSESKRMDERSQEKPS